MNQSTPASVSALILLCLFPWLGGFYDGILGIGAFWGVVTVNPTGYHPHLSLWGANAIFSWVFFLPYSVAVVSGTLGATTEWRDTWVTISGLGIFVTLSITIAMSLKLVPIGAIVAISIIWRLYLTSTSNEASLEDSLLEADSDTPTNTTTTTATTQESVNRSVIKEDYSILVANVDETARCAKRDELQQTGVELTALEMERVSIEEIPEEEATEYASEFNILERRQQQLCIRVSERLRQSPIQRVVVQSLDSSVKYASPNKDDLPGNRLTADVFTTTTLSELESTTIAIRQIYIEKTFYTKF